MGACTRLTTGKIFSVMATDQASAPTVKDSAASAAGEARSEGVSAESGSHPERGEISAATIARMMGLATVSETKLVESKVDLLTAKLNAVQVKLEKALAMLGNVATGADLERVDVQVGALRQLIREVMAGVEIKKSEEIPEEGKKPGTRIQSNS